MDIENTLPKNIQVLVDIIVPVYAGLMETQECIESVLATLPDWARLIVINDASPEPELTVWLRMRAHSASFILLENEINLGFVATVNRGMRLNSQNDILLLNSDVEVANNWLERMREAAYSRHSGSITPFSNNATICSFPNYCEDNTLPLGLTLQELDALFANSRFSDNLLEVPTGVGFCMYIRRDCLNEIGYFDEQVFGRGYGEENDWCQRAAKAGWPSFHLLNVFVFHKGGVSFMGEADSRKALAIKLLTELHPNYARDVAQYIVKDSAKKARSQLILQIFAAKKTAKILLISHNMGGGVEQHIRELAEHHKGNVCFVLLKPAMDKGKLSLSFPTQDNLKDIEELIFIEESGFELLLETLRFIGIGHIHFHHLMGLSDKVLSLSNLLDCQYDITIHDYYLINGNPTLTDKKARFIGDENPLLDEISATVYQIPKKLTAEQWRTKIAPWLKHAKRVIFPSADTYLRFVRYFPECETNGVVAWHYDSSLVVSKQIKHDKRSDATLRVLILGALSLEKGAVLLDKVAKKLQHEQIEFHLLGYTSFSLHRSIVCHGPYHAMDIADKLNKIQPDVVWFPAQWPETYSYTLSIAFEYGLPVVIPNIGAFYERVLNRAYSRVIPWDLSIDPLCELWRSIHRDFKTFFAMENIPAVLPFKNVDIKKNFYQDEYLEDIALRGAERRVVDDYAFIESLFLSKNVEIKSKVLFLTYREKLLALLWKLDKVPMISWVTKWIPYQVKKWVKRRFSSKPIHQVLRSPLK